MAQTAPKRTQSSTSLSRFYNAGTNGGGPIGEDEMADPRMDFCNAFWGQGDRGYEVVMARLRGAGRTLEELKAFWKERAAIEEDYSRRLQKLSKTTMGKDEIGDLAAAIQNCLVETGQQAQYHQSLAGEIRTNVEQPTAELAARLVGFKKGQQASIEKSWRNKGLQEGHVTKARERYESDCLKLNSYTANQALTQGKEADKLQQKQERIRKDIGQGEGEIRQFVRVLEGTQAKWENEWKGFCDIVQDLEEDRLAMTKDIIWAYANAVSQVCVEDDSSCERVREKLEQFEPMNDMVAFVRGWGTGDQIPDPPRFINYSAGEYPPHPSSHLANFQRETNKTPLSSLAQYVPEPRSAVEPTQNERDGNDRSQANGSGKSHGLTGGMGDLSLQDRSDGPPAPPSGNDKPKAPFGGVAMPGMAPPAPSSPAPAVAEAVPKRYSSMGPPAPATTMTLPEPRVPSRQGPPTPNQVDDEDPMAKALADLRTQPPSGSIRRGTSHRRPESMYSGAGSTVSRNGTPGITSPPPGSSGNRMSYQPPPTGALSPPPAGHTAAALAKSMDEFQRQSNTKRGSVSYSGYGQDVVGAHPTSRSASPAPSAGGGGGRGPTSAMMQPPSQPATHIADGVLSQYHQAFPGERERERSRSRAGSVASARSGGGNSFIAHPVSSNHGQPPASPTPREGFSGIGAGGRSPSPAPPGNFASPVPSPNVAQGNLGPQNMGIKLDASGGVAQDSMAEAYRRQYQQQQQGSYGQGQGQGGMGGGGFAGYQAISQPTQQQQQQYGGPNAGPKSPGIAGPPPIGSQRPTSAYGQHQPPQQSSAPYQPPTQYARPPSTNGSYTQSQQHPPRGQSLSSSPYPAPGPSYNSPTTGGYSNAAAPPTGYQNSYAPPGPPGPPQTGYSNQYAPAPPQQQNQYQRSASPAPGSAAGYGRSASPAPPHQPSMQHQQSYQSQQPYQRAPSPQPQPQQGRPQSYQQQQQQQSPAQYGYQPPMVGGGYQQQPPAQQQQQHQPQQQQQQRQQQQSRMQRSPSPQPGVAPVNAAPTGQWSTTGLPVLFYVKALYDYQAQSGVEFDFQAGDIIAVTSTPEDGWWSGELLDEARRLPGRTDFPSNFVCLF